MAEKRRMLPIRKATLELDGDYEGWSCTVRKNPPLRIFSDLQSGDFDRITEGLTLVILDWNFVDEAGKKMADPSLETVGLLPFDLAMQVANKFSEVVTSLPPA